MIFWRTAPRVNDEAFTLIMIDQDEYDLFFSV